MKRVVCLLVVLLLLISAMPVAYAYEMNDNLAEVFFVLKDLGFSDVAAAAIAGNVYQESRGTPSAVEGGRHGVGIGVFQQGTNYNRQALEDYCSGAEHANHPKVTLRPAVAPKGYTVCNLVRCHVEFSLKDIANRFSWCKWSKNYNTQVQKLSVLSEGVSSGSIPASINVVNSWSGFKEQEDLATAVIQFMCDYETPNASSCFWVGINTLNESSHTQYSFIDSFNERYGVALEIYNTYCTPVVEEEEPVVETVDVVDKPVENAYEESAVMAEPQIENMGNNFNFSMQPLTILETPFFNEDVLTSHFMELSSLRSDWRAASLPKSVSLAHSSAILETESIGFPGMRQVFHCILALAVAVWAYSSLCQFKKGVSSGQIVKISAVNRRALVCIAVIYIFISSF